MIIVRPAAVNDATLTSSNVTETEETEWVTGTTYGAGTTVQRTVAGTHSIYRSLKASNVGNKPEDDNLVTPEWWARVRATNRWAMFSDQINDRTSRTGNIAVTLTPGDLVNAVALFNLDATSVRIKMTDPTDGVVYDQTRTLVDDSGVNDWYAWYFEPITRQETLAVLDLPPYVLAATEITIARATGTAKCGLLTLGAQRRLGESDYGTGVGVVDYSRKERDTFGNPVVVKRNFSKRADYDVTVPTGFVNSIENTLANLRTTPMTYIGSVHFPSTIIYGYYRDFSVILSNPTTSILSIDVEGLT